MDETVTITKSEYEKLKKDQRWLRCLEAAGVDNWEGFGVAIDTREADEGDEDK